VKCAVAANLGYYHDDPDGISFLGFAVPTSSYLIGGGHYVRGGSVALSDRLAASVREAGGKVLTDQTVVRLDVAGDRIAGVVYHGPDSEIIEAAAPRVFGNAAPSVLADLLPADRRAVFLSPYLDRPPSISLWTVAFGLSRPAAELGVRHFSTFLLPDWMTTLADMRDSAAIMAEPEGPRLPPFVLADYSRIDSGLPPGPPYLVTLCGIDRLSTWGRLGPKETRLRKDLWMERLSLYLDTQFPGFAAAVTQREMSTAATMRQFLNTPDGAVYGFAPGHWGGGARTPIRGLYLASAWTMGGGFTGAMLGGAMAVRDAGRDH
jgi:phytoene dehydrogenase-like protein